MLAHWKAVGAPCLDHCTAKRPFQPSRGNPNRRQSPSHSLSRSTSKPCSRSPDLLVYPVGIEVSSGIKAGPSWISGSDYIGIAEQQRLLRPESAAIQIGRWLVSTVVRCKLFRPRSLACCFSLVLVCQLWQNSKKDQTSEVLLSSPLLNCSNVTPSVGLSNFPVGG